MTLKNPWEGGPGPDGLWISSVDRRRVDRYNARLSTDDPTVVRYMTQGGRPLVPGAWSGNPWTAPIVLLLLNPAVSEYTDGMYSDPACLTRVADVAMGRWDPDYPNAWLHPEVRRHEPWCSRVVCGNLHRILLDRGVGSEEAWSLLSQKISVLELSPWVSHRWSVGAVVETTQLSVALAQNAMLDPKRTVLLGRGESIWRSVGLLDVDLLPMSTGVRGNQCRITQSNFSTAWGDILSHLT